MTGKDKTIEDSKKQGGGGASTPCSCPADTRPPLITPEDELYDPAPGEYPGDYPGIPDDYDDDIEYRILQHFKRFVQERRKIVGYHNLFREDTSYDDTEENEP